MNSQFFDILNSLGISVDENTSPIVLFCAVNLLLSIISILCVLNIILYLIVIYISDNDKFLKWISNYNILKKVFSLYKKTRQSYLVFEFIILLINIGSIIWLNFSLINGLT